MTWSIAVKKKVPVIAEAISPETLPYFYPILWLTENSREHTPAKVAPKGIIDFSILIRVAWDFSVGINISLGVL